MYQHLRWKPVKSIETWDPTGVFDPTNLNGVKNISYIYPLLNDYFRVPQPWIVEDQDRGLIRLVPATNVQMLPLFALQLSFMGFSDSVPGGMWYQYTAGLTANDYNSQWSFMQQLVLAEAALIALSNIQLSVNFGAIENQTQIDGLSYRTRYANGGAFAGQITTYTNMAKMLMRQAKQKVSGPTMGII